MNNTYNIPVWEKYTLSIEEAAAYFRIGEHKLRNLINENKNADYLLWNGNRVQIKRVKFEKFVDTLEAIQGFEQGLSGINFSQNIWHKFSGKPEDYGKNVGVVIY